MQFVTIFMKIKALNFFVIATQKLHLKGLHVEFGNLLLATPLAVK